MKTLLLTAALLPAAHAATIIPLTGNAMDSSTPAFSSSITGTTNDGFAYNPADPLSTTPSLTFSPTASYHADEPNGGDVTLTYTLNHSIAAPENTIVFDIWGRSGNTTWEDRDDDFAVEIFDAVGLSLGSVTGLAIADSPNTQHARANFGTLPVGTTITRLVVTAFDSEASSPTNNFTVQEVRLAAIAIPEPSTSLLSSLAALTLLSLRRRK